MSPSTFFPHLNALIRRAQPTGGLLTNYTSDAVGGDNPDLMFTHGLVGVNQPANYLFAEVLGLSLAGMCVVALLFRIVFLGNAQMRYLFTLANPEQQRYWSRNRTNLWPKIKQHLLYAPLFKTRHNRELQLSSAVSIGTLPSRWHTLLLTVYLLTNIGYVLVLPFGDSNPAAVLAGLRGRSGELSVINLVPTILFALRNNPLIPLLRVSYDTFNLLHRWCARMTVLQAVVHTAAYLANEVNAGGMKLIGTNLAQEPSYQWGMVATGAFTIIIIQASSPIRHAFYETFLVLHRVLIVLGLVGLWLHIEIANLPQLPFLRAVFVMWGAEWAIRLWSVYYHNMSMKKGMTRVTVEALPAEACRVTFDLVRPWKFVPGAHAHVWLPSMSFWSTHPFSIAWAEDRSRNQDLALDMEKLPNFHDRKSSTYKAGPTITIPKHSDMESAACSGLATSVSFVMRARAGMTRKLYDKASAAPGGKLVIRGGIEGPYGGHESLSSYGTVILFAGGVGITHGVSYVKYLLTQYAEGTCSCRRILLVWSVPNTESLEWVRPWMDQVLRMEGRKDILRVQLFVTKPRHQNEVNSRTGTVQMFPGRCNPATVIDKEVQDRVGAVGITVCGPGAFADSVRAAARNRVQNGSVDFIEEAFTY